MKQQLLALSLVAASGLIAQNDMQQPNNYANSNSCCKRCCCEPCCCVPEPKKCINCECYTPQYYDLQCDWGAFITVDFLYWYARETDLSYALKVFGKGQNATDEDLLVFAPNTYKNIDTSWDPGVRVGLGWNTDCDGWDVYLHWTYYHNKETNSISVPDYQWVTAGQSDINLPGVNQAALINPWINQSFHLNSDSMEEIRTFDHVRGRWKFTLNSIDLEFGRKYWLSKCFTLRPYTGLRGAWIKTKFNTKSSRNTTDPVTDETVSILFKDRFTNRDWGVGFIGGVQPNFFFCSNFILFGNVEASLIWGEFEAKKKERYLRENVGTGGTTTVISYHNKSNHDFFQMTAILDLGIGLRWEEHWCCDRYSTALDFGWEHHIWLDQNHRMKSFDHFASAPGTGEVFNGFRTYEEATGNIGFGGFVLRGRFDF